jgi:predicted RNA-binding protein (virulence factor B family)
MEIGKHHTLTLARFTDFGAFLEDEAGDEVLLPNKFVTKQMKLGDQLDVFLHLDNEERLTATTQTPKIKLNSFAALRVADTSSIGAFLEWGIDKQLFVPFIEQKERMQKGKTYVVHMHVDKLTERLVASAKIKQFLSPPPSDLKVNQEVDMLIYRFTDLGLECIVNNHFLGLLYTSEILKPLSIGQEVKGYISKVREEDGKVDLSLRPSGYENHIDADCALLLARLENNHGYLDLHDKSDPAEIVQRLQLSKKAFKKAVGRLYREKRISLDGNGIRLNK